MLCILATAFPLILLFNYSYSAANVFVLLPVDANKAVFLHQVLSKLYLPSLEADRWNQLCPLPCHRPLLV